MDDTQHGLVGSSVSRREDDRLVRGGGSYIDDLSFADQGHMVLVRSPFAHATIGAVEVSQACSMPGVRSVLTAKEIETAGLRPLGCHTTIPGQRNVVRPIIAASRVRHIGEIVAAVIADTKSHARDAAEAVDVDYQELPVAADLNTGLHSSATPIHEPAPGNIGYTWQNGDAEAVASAFDSAASVASLTVENNRVIINPMETRGAIGLFDRNDGRFCLHAPTQGVHLIRNILAEEIFDVPLENIRVVTGDVGGAFGMKFQAYPELVLVLLGAKLTGRPVKWIADRTESFLCDVHGRAQSNTIELALDADGNFTGLRMDALADLGAYFTTFTTAVATVSGTRALGHTYRIPAIHVRVRGVFTNTPPVEAYRGAGKPEMVYALERLIEKVAAERRHDSIVLRRQNLIQSTDLPYENPLGEIIDSGDFQAVMDRALSRADWNGFANRRTFAVARGKLAGIGIGLHIHATGAFTDELTRIDVDGARRVVTVRTGTQTGGQGHETVFAQIVADRLDIPMEAIDIHQGDTAELETGAGTGGSSALPIAAVNMARAAVQLVDHGRTLASFALEASPADINYEAGFFCVTGTDRKIDLFALATQAADMTDLPDDVDNSLETGCVFTGPYTSYPNGCYVAEVEVDPETGHVDLLRLTTVDDIGTVINPVIAGGQIAGGVAQSLGQALLEHTVFEPETGQLQSGSLMDYCLPRADNFPHYEPEFRGIACKINPLGVKGAGELGCIGGLAPVVNAVINALTPLGVNHIDMPMTPERVWTAINRAGKPIRDSDPALR